MTVFRLEHGSIDNVIDLVSSVEHKKSRRRISAAKRLDVKGAFDCVQHRAILDASCEIKLGGSLSRWAEGYLKSRNIHVSIRDGDTNPVTITSGAPQGAVLSHTFLTIMPIGLSILLQKQCIYHFMRRTFVYGHCQFHGATFPTDTTKR